MGGRVAQGVRRLTIEFVQVESVDHWIWHLHSCHFYIVSSAYNKLTKIDINQHQNPHHFCWLKVLPLKMSIFIWRLLRKCRKRIIYCVGALLQLPSKVARRTVVRMRTFTIFFLNMTFIENFGILFPVDLVSLLLSITRFFNIFINLAVQGVSHMRFKTL